MHTVVAATVLPKFLKFWAPPHDLALFFIVGSCEPFGRALVLDDFKNIDSRPVFQRLCVFEVVWVTDCEFGFADGFLKGRCFGGEMYFDHC